MGNDFELNEKKIPVLWKTQLDPEIMQSYIIQGYPSGTSHQPTHTCVKEAGTSCISESSPSIRGDQVDVGSKSTLPPPDILGCVQDCHGHTQQDVCNNTAASHAVPYSNPRQDGVWSGQNLVPPDQLPHQTDGQQVHTLAQGDGLLQIILPNDTRPNQYFTEPIEIATSPQYSYPNPCNDEPFQYLLDPQGSLEDVALTTPHGTYHQTSPVAQSSTFSNNDISLTMRDMAVPGSWSDGGNVFEISGTNSVERHGQWCT